jgi:hypothetical protein
MSTDRAASLLMGTPNVPKANMEQAAASQPQVSPQVEEEVEENIARSLSLSLDFCNKSVRRTAATAFLVVLQFSSPAFRDVSALNPSSNVHHRPFFFHRYNFDPRKATVSGWSRLFGRNGMDEGASVMHTIKQSAYGRLHTRAPLKEPFSYTCWCVDAVVMVG